MTRAIGLAGLSLILAAATATAREPEALKANIKTFCSANYFRLCPDMDPNGKEVVACFRKNMAEVSPGCRAAIAEYRAKGAGGKP